VGLLGGLLPYVEHKSAKGDKKCLGRKNSIELDEKKRKITCYSRLEMRGRK
jgi:hypothetical protein